MRVELDNLLKQLEPFRREFRNVSRETGMFLNQLIKKYKPKNILEIGMSNGYSAIWLASAAEEINAKAAAIEIDENKISLAKENFKRAALKNINIIHGAALEIIPKLKEKYDFIFIDAVKSEYLKYLRLLIPKLNKPAVITAHNVISWKHKMLDYLEFVKQFKTKTYKELDLEVTYFH